MYRKFHFIFLVLLFSLEAYSGKAECINIFLNPQSVRSHIVDEGVSSWFLEGVLESVKNVNSKLDLLVTPEDYKIVLGPKSIKTQGKSKQKAGSKFLTARAYEKVFYAYNGPGKKMQSFNPIYSIGTATHEYGHILFFPNLRNFVNEQLIKDYIESYDLREFIHYHEDEVTKNYDRDWNEIKERFPEEKIFIEYIGSLKKEPSSFIEEEALSDLKEESYDLQIATVSVHKIVKSYSELFADVIAVVGTKNPKVMYKSTRKNKQVKKIKKNKKDKKDYDRINGRDFTANISKYYWNDESIHQLFSPFRSYFYKNYLKNPSFKNRENELIYNLMASIGKELDRRAIDPKDDTILELNEALISTFDSLFLIK